MILALIGGLSVRFISATGETGVLPNGSDFKFPCSENDLVKAHYISDLLWAQ